MIPVLLSFTQLEHLVALAMVLINVANTPFLIFGVLSFCISFACLAIWRAAPDYRVLLKMGLFFAVIFGVEIYQYRAEPPYEYLGVFQVFTSLFFVETAAEAIKVRNRGWTRLLWPLYLALAIAGWFPNTAFVRNWPIFISEGSLVILAIQGFRYGTARDRLTASVFLGYFLVRSTLAPGLQRITHIPISFMLGGWRWQISNGAVFLLGAVTLAIVVRDLIRDRREKLRLSMEVEAARLVQQVLIPEEIPTVAGFLIRSVYKPYSEVGGDFFQILPTSGGGLLIVVGDVSGKGMPAAMTVSLLVGMVRGLTRSTESPGEILAAMNQGMLARSGGGFTTCIVIRADRDGSVTVANAGHMAPYLKGKELKVESGLPLGLAADSSYTESTFSMACQNQLTLVTDGVVEARNVAGELLGFERTAAMAGESAEMIAQKAREFGQNDDITVLTLVRLPFAEELTAEVTEPVLSPSIA